MSCFPKYDPDLHADEDVYNFDLKARGIWVALVHILRVATTTEQEPPIRVQRSFGFDKPEVPKIFQVAVNGQSSRHDVQEVSGTPL